MVQVLFKMEHIRQDQEESGLWPYCYEQGCCYMFKYIHIPIIASSEEYFPSGGEEPGDRQACIALQEGNQLVPSPGTLRRDFSSS